MYRLLTVLVCAFFYFVQLEANAQVWFFGQNQVLDLSESAPEVRFDREANALFTKNGCAVQHDAETGEILFYTDGMTIYDASGTPMPMAYFEEFSEAYHSTVQQGAVTFQLPGSDSLYYVIGSGVSNMKGVDQDRWYHEHRDHARYYIVDMSGRDGMGEVVERGYLNFGENSEISEGIALTYDCQDGSYWVVVRKKEVQDVVVFKFTEAGLFGTYDARYGQEAPNGFGVFIEISPKGDLICVTTPNDQRNAMRFYSLDTQGHSEKEIISHTRYFEAPLGWPRIQQTQFSPSGEYLYYTTFNSRGRIYQVSVPKILNHTVNLYPEMLVDDFRVRPAIQLFDSEILVGGTIGVSRIERPDSPSDSCGLVLFDIPNNSGSTVDASFPNLLDGTQVVDKFSPCPFPFARAELPDSICVGTPLELKSTSPDTDTWVWSITGTDKQQLTGEAPGDIVFNEIGRQSIKLKTWWRDKVDSAEFNVEVLETPFVNILGPDTIQACEFELLTVEASTNTDNAQFEWSGADFFEGSATASTVRARLQNGPLVVTTYTHLGCTDSDTVYVVGRPREEAILYLNSFRTDRWSPKNLYVMADFTLTEGEFSERPAEIILAYATKDLYYTGKSSFENVQVAQQGDSTYVRITTPLLTTQVRDTLGYLEMRAQTKEFAFSGVRIDSIYGGDPCVYIPEINRVGASITIDDVTSVSDITSEQSFAVTPNVGRLEDMRLTLTQTMNTNQVHVYDMLGRVRSYNLAPAKYEYTLSELLGSIGRGQYILRIGTETVAFVVESE